VRTEQVDPWDIDISLLSQKYIEVVKKLHEFDFRLSGKVLLAAAILLHIKSVRFIEFDITNLNNLINPPAALDEDSYYEQLPLKNLPMDKITLIPKTPQPRKRKVSVYDLIDALTKALEVRRRRVLRDVEVPAMLVPEKRVDITKVIYELYQQIKKLLGSKEKVFFTDLIGNAGTREDKVYTFVPLLYLTNQGKINLEQEIDFGDIEVKFPGAEEEKNA
jgi:segregation and condensation protein A